MTQEQAINTIDLYYSLGGPEFLKQKKDHAKDQLEKIKVSGYTNEKPEILEIKIRPRRQSEN